VIGEILHRIPASLQLAIPAAFLALAISIPAGIISAIHRNRLVDQMVRICSLAGASIPSFWLALLLIIFLAVKLSLVPVAGRVGASSVLLPALALAVTPAAILARFTRSAMLEILGEDYIRSARAKGLPERLVVGRHALRNALLPVITAFGTSLGHLISGAVVIESIFAWPGFGKLALDAILQRDYPMIQGYVLFTGMVFVALNLIIDLSYTRIDPRIRFGGGFIRDAAR
jgi:peptide/nickel transport system permease protein